MLLKVFFLLLAFVNVYCDRKIVCYWLHFNPIESIDPQLCTHIHYSFTILDKESLHMKFENSNEVDIVKKVNGLKVANPNLKHILALGGGLDSGDGDKYSRLVSSAQSRNSFVQQSVEFLKKYNFDGLDLDWEYPACPHTDCDAGHASDKQNFATLLKELRAAFDQQTHKLSLSTAVNAGQWLTDKAYDYSVLNSSLDYVNIMTYDNAGTWNTKTGHHADFDWVKNSMNFWSTHVIKSKLLMGVPFYGISFTLKDPNQHGIGAPVTASGAEQYKKICTDVKKNGWKKEYIHPYGSVAYKGNQWVGYDDPNRIMQKAEWVRENGFGGILIWEISQDDIHGNCCATNRPLIRAVNYGLLQKGSAPNTYNCE